MYTKEIAMKEINETQDFYVNELIKKITEPNYDVLKYINFTSPTGTGKTNMLAKLMNLLQPPKYYFIITTLSKGQLHIQTASKLYDLCEYKHFSVFGTQDYKINSRLQAEDIISNFPHGSKVIWIRDEGHIATNKWDDLLIEKCFKVINFSATNKNSDIVCNFAHTMMLRTVNQHIGTPEDAIRKLLEIKEAHKCVERYNPCAIFRCINTNIKDQIIELCVKNDLKHIDITDNQYDIQQLCEDDNEYDVIINKFKIVEGIDIRRAHILYIDNRPNNDATTVQAIGRCRRNALLYRTDIDILQEQNSQLLKKTRECFVYFNCKEAKLRTDDDGEFDSDICDIISVQQIKSGSTITINNGRLFNGLLIKELEKETGEFFVYVDESTGFNFVKPNNSSNFYTSRGRFYEGGYAGIFYDDSYYKISKSNILKLPEHIKTVDKIFDYVLGRDRYIIKPDNGHYLIIPVQPYLVPVVCDEKIRKELDDILHFVENIPIIGRCEHEFSETNYLKIPESKRQYREKALSDKLSCRFLNEDVTKRIIYYFSSFIWDWDYMRKVYSYFSKYASNSNRLYSDCLCIIQKFLSNHPDKLESFNCLEFLHNMFYNNTVSFMGDKIFAYNNIPQKFEITTDYIESVRKKLTNTEFLTPDMIEKFYKFYDILCSGHTSIWIDCSKLFQKSSDSFYCNVRKSLQFSQFSNKYRLDKGKIGLLFYKSYQQITNDFESALIGFDSVKQVRDQVGKGVIWIEDKAVTSKVKKYCKFNSFIESRYSEELDSCRTLLFNGKNNFRFDTRANKCLGYCVEYFSKYLLYGKSFLHEFITKALHESGYTEKDMSRIGVSNPLIVRACMLCYQYHMKKCYGDEITKVIKGISINQLIQDKYKEFVDTVVELGTKVYDFVKNNIYTHNDTPIPEFDPNLSIDHITALADYITQDTILDVKCTNHIDMSMVKQVLAYYYLSTKRSDLSIKRVIVYDAVSGRNVTINIQN